MPSFAKMAKPIFGVAAVLLLTAVAAYCFDGCVACNSNTQAHDSEERVAATDVTDLPHEYLPVLNLDALSRETSIPEGASGGLMTHQWKVEGEVTELDEKNDVAVLSVDVEDPYFRYLNSPVAFLVDCRPEIIVGDRVRVTFLPPGSEETIIRPSDLTVLQTS